MKYPGISGINSMELNPGERRKNTKMWNGKIIKM
jgi:hypothetical protein